ncbi:hypothetical protein ACFYSC_18250 [Streptosporangium sp. NPDC004379]|uniref:hypothetical protein n=1 Tax=Streptosporangium sp. NPDC004379 TaxID=3366189 RepID=UPI0036B74EF4
MIVASHPQIDHDPATELVIAPPTGSQAAVAVEHAPAAGKPVRANPPSPLSPHEET